MNQTAKSLGMNHTHFVNPSGWHHANQKSTAHDIALLLRALYRRFPQYIHLLGLSGVTKNGQWRRNTNALLGKINGMVAGKTGYTIPAGWNLATLTQRHGMTLITVVMGMPNRIARDRHVEQLTEAALSLCQLAQAPQGVGRPNRAPVLVARSVDPTRTGKKTGLRPKMTAKRRQKSSRRVAQNTPRAKQGRIATPAKRPKKTVSKKSKG
jgi:D-alanyl-D-alanine carboxypeptidase